MNYTLEAHISSNSLKQDVVNTAMATAEKRTGRISSSDDEQMKIYFGSRIKTRFFGVWFLSESKKFQFPTKLQIDLRHVDDQHFFTLKFSDDLGETIPDSYSRNSYDRYYRSIIDDFCQKLQVIRVEIIKENNSTGIHNIAPDYRPWAVAGVFFFIPFAAIAFWYANKSFKYATRGDTLGSIKNAKLAKLWIALTFTAGVLINIYLFIDDISNV